MKDWGYTRYGKTASLSIADNYEKEWGDLTGAKNAFGIVDYNPDTLGMQETVDVIAGVASDRVDCYTYSCDCHGDNSNDTIIIALIKM